ncbi:MAG: universal stress protein [Rhodothermales bacterium]|nr:universal stress protein [Rhodothermales bacterium]
MRTINTILVAHDFSSCSTQALKDGIELAIAKRASLHLLYVEVIHADSPLDGAGDTAKAVRMRDMLHGAIQENVASLGREMADIPSFVYCVTRDFAAAPAILQYAHKNAVDLIVLGTHGRRGLLRKLIGSTAEEVVRLAPCPVLTIREQVQSQPLTSSVGAILVPIDFSDSTPLALAAAREWADFFDARLDLVHVVEEKMHPAFYNTGVFSMYDVNPDLEATVIEHMKKLYAQAPGSGGPVRFIVRHGHAVRELLEAARELGDDLIVIATHGLSGLDRALMGSVSERIVRQAEAPVITLRGGGAKPLARTVRHEPATAAS